VDFALAGAFKPFLTTDFTDYTDEIPRAYFRKWRNRKKRVSRLGLESVSSVQSVVKKPSAADSAMTQKIRAEPPNPWLGQLSHA
jgi:hypothetical protein